MKENKTEIKKELEGAELEDNELEGVTGGVTDANQQIDRNRRMKKSSVETNYFEQP